MRRFDGRLLIVSAVLLLAGCQASTVPQASESQVSIAPATSATSSPSAAASEACDPVDEMFARMFVGLSEAALSNAGIDPEQFLNALAEDRELLERYFGALGIPVEDAWIDAAISADLGEQLIQRSRDGCAVFGEAAR